MLKLTLIIWSHETDDPEKKMDQIPKRETEKRDLVNKDVLLMIRGNETPGPAQHVLAN